MTSDKIKNLAVRIWKTAGFWMLGIILVLVSIGLESDHPKVSKFLEHLGVALMIATVVAIIIHLQEFSEFFEKMATGVMLNYDFLKGLELTKIRRVRELAARAIVAHYGEGNSDYNWSDLTEAVDKQIFDRQFPDDFQPTDGAYRTDYWETYHIKRLNAAEVERNLKLSSGTLSTTRSYTERKNVVSYDIHIPNTSVSRITVPFFFEVSPTDGIAPDKLVSLRFGSNEQFANPHRLVSSRKTGSNTIRIHPDPTLQADMKNGKGHVWMEVIDYTPDDIEPFLLSTMQSPTRPAVGNFAIVTLENFAAERTVKCQIWGAGGTLGEKRLQNGLQVTYDKGWLLADHGFIFWW